MMKTITLRGNMNYEEFSAQQNEKLSTVLATIDSDSFDKESIKNEITNLLKTQDEYGKTSYSKKAGQVNKYLEVLSKLGYDKESYENPDDFVTKFNEKNNSVDSRTADYQLMEARLRKIEQEKQAETDRAEQLKSKSDKNTIENKLREALDKELRGSKYIIKDLISDNKVKLIDGEVVFTNGDQVILFEDGVSKLLEENEELRVVNIKPGAGSTSRIIKDSQGKLSMEAINKMSPEQIKASMAEIKKLAGIR